MSKNKSYIYVLYDPRIEEPRYVGKTNKTVEERIKQHIRSARLSPKKSPLLDWIRYLLREGQRPQGVVIDEVLSSQWQRAEKFWIGWFRLEYNHILNITDGGDGGRIPPGYVFSAERNRKIREALKKRWSVQRHHTKGAKIHSEEWKRKLSQRMQGNKQGLGNRSRTGQKRSLEERRKVAASLRGRKHHSEKWKRELSRRMRGNTFGRRERNQ